jgi:ferredoxin
VYYITLDNFIEFLELLKDTYEVYVPVKKGDQRFYKKYSEFTNDIVIGEVRAYEPLKSFFYPARETVAQDFKPDIPHDQDKPAAVIGAKACDLKGFKVLDYVFKNHDYPDPSYNKTRQDNFIIAADCTCAIDTCFCLALDVKPYPQVDFDLNLSQVEGGYIVKVGSKKGTDFVKKNSSLFKAASKASMSQRDFQRKRVVKEVKKNIKDNEVPHQDSFKGIIEEKYESDIWKDEVKTCIECGACNTVCPTCHCFLLYDQKDQKRMARFRIWDSCMLKDFARVAGGANPREKLWMRLRNRFEKKFDFFPKVADIYACTGCGRCISSCGAKIDIRGVLKKLVSHV